MPLPSSGSISAAQINTELGRASNAPFSLGGATERGLAGVPSGGLSFASFHGKASEIAKTLTGGTGAVTLQSLFTNAEWTSSTPKRVTLPAGAIRGRSDSTAAVVTVGPDAWAGSLTFDVHGTIEGAGGAANGGVGGNAFDANRTGLTGQRVNVNVFGALRAGGGGGGAGGKGGDGSATVTVREPATGNAYVANVTQWTISDNTTGGQPPWMTRTNGRWQGTTVINQNRGGAAPMPIWSVVFNGWTYFADQTAPISNGVFGVFRTQDQTGATIGGAGGAGGRGEGHGQTRSDGIAGLVGGANAGQGGTGGRGGLFGADGNGGSSGTNGTVTGGAAGGSAGLSGFAIANLANATLINNGTLLGRT